MNYLEDKRITITKNGGPYFSKITLNNIIGLLAHNVLEMTEVDGVEVSYNNLDDFYYLVFDRNGHHCVIKYYKVLSVTIDGEDHWRGCPFYIKQDFIRSIKRATKQGLKMPEHRQATPKEQIVAILSSVEGYLSNLTHRLYGAIGVRVNMKITEAQKQLHEAQKLLEKLPPGEW